MPDTPDNQPQFTRITAAILALLYRSFPVVRNISLDDVPQCDDDDAQVIFFSSVSFLENEGFLTYALSEHGGYSGVRLTARGLAALGTRLPHLSPSRELGYLVAESADSGEVLREIMRQFVLN